MTFKAILSQAQVSEMVYLQPTLTGILGWSLFPITNYYQGWGLVTTVFCGICVCVEGLVQRTSQLLHEVFLIFISLYI